MPTVKMNGLNATQDTRDGQPLFAPREVWKGHRSALDSIENIRASILKPTDLAYEVAKGNLEAFEEAFGLELVGFCEGCGEPIFKGDKYHVGVDVYLDVKCAPSYASVLEDPSSFINEAGEPMTPEEARAMVDRHLAIGGSLEDMV